jgi:hypothetical protein
MTQRSVLSDVALAYGHSKQNYERAAGRGDFDRADEAMSEMQEIERCVHVHETSTSWRSTISARLKREAAQR